MSIINDDGFNTPDYLIQSYLHMPSNELTYKRNKSI
ncbi:hypothetical protein EV695_1366 [Cocleimonas flava]|uniref:Uncharacterized protein n=1 Tax=Cocleimonas flava TaxID=634765 RepID=A0A4R1F537_9GAMM|nr:hypothetical protein EV695_1366 [Cocleimonas flava]